MALEAFLDSNSQYSIPMTIPISGAGGILGGLNSHSSLNNLVDLDSILGQDAAVAVANLIPPTGGYLHSYGNPNMEAMRYSSNNPGNVFSANDTFSHLSQGVQKERAKQEWESNTGSLDLRKSRLKTSQDLLPIRIKKDPNAFIPIPKKPRLDGNQENIQQQQRIQELLLKEVQDYNTQIKAIVKQHRHQNQQQSILHSAPQLGGFHMQLQENQKRLLQDHIDERGTFVPFLDGDICSQRFMEYLHHLRSNIHDNDITGWRKFVSKYYAPGSKRRWCFSTYENIQLQAPGVFCHKSMERWCCDICGSTSGNGLEATFDILPRLFKIKFESGMLDEFSFLDLPRACRTPYGLVLEYGKAVQESVYENFRVVHEGKLRIGFGHDLKILSWEFCAHNHEEYLSRGLITPQIKCMIQAAENSQNNIQNGGSHRFSSEYLWANSNMLVLAGNHLKRNVELPLVNDLGYPKRFIRCLQIAEIFDSMKDLMTFSFDMKVGPIESLIKNCQASKIDNQMEVEKCRTEQFMNAQNLPTYPEQSDPGNHANGWQLSRSSAMSGSENAGLATGNLNNQLLRQESPTVTLRRKLHDGVPELMPQSPEHGTNPQVLVNKLLHNMSASNRGKNEAVHQSKHVSVSSNASLGAASAQVNLADASRAAANLPKITQNVTFKAEPHSPEQPQAAFHGSTTSLSTTLDFNW